MAIIIPVYYEPMNADNDLVLPPMTMPKLFLTAPLARVWLIIATTV